ncbi:MAG: PEGA domain-containing protein [Gammaproteobacteria bacterium]|nr:PEGA domain-containing protein [Gammaproteobacteria bacterium]MDH5653457.1 PEGA domain-containing protein [Gammaproteobacteria bacterium]
MHSKFIFILALLTILFGSGCSTISKKSDFVNVFINSIPEGGKVRYDGKIYTTPANIPIKRGHDNIILRVEKEGYESASVTLKRAYDLHAMAADCAIPLINLVTCPIGLNDGFSSGRAYTVEPRSVTLELVRDLSKEREQRAQQQAANLLRVETRFINKSWFPLEKHEMTVACVDEALENLSKGTHFRFLEKDSKLQVSETDNVGTITFYIDLIETAQLVKLKVVIQTADGTTYIANARESIQGKSRAEIYNAFEKVGVVVAKDITEQVSR